MTTANISAANWCNASRGRQVRDIHREVFGTEMRNLVVWLRDRDILLLMDDDRREVVGYALHSSLRSDSPDGRSMMVAEWAVRPDMRTPVKWELFEMLTRKTKREKPFLRLGSNLWDEHTQMVLLKLGFVGDIDPEPGSQRILWVFDWNKELTR